MYRRRTTCRPNTSRVSFAAADRNDIPENREHIEELEVATPLTMMRYLNSPDGAIYG